MKDLAARIQQANRQRSGGDLPGSAAMLNDVLAELQSDPHHDALVEKVLSNQVAGALNEEEKEKLLLHAEALHHLNVVHSDQDHYDLAEKAIHQSHALAVAAGQPDPSRFQESIAGLDRRRGHAEKAIKGYTENIAALESAGKHSDAMWSLDGLAHSYAAQGRMNEALATREKALAIAQGLENDPPAYPTLLAMKACDQFKLGRLAEADRNITEADGRFIALETPNPRGASYTSTILGDVRRAQGRSDEAGSAYRQAALFDDAHTRAKAQLGLGWLEQETGTPVAAGEAFKKAVEANHDDQALKTEARAGLALALQRQGQTEEAAKLIDEARQHPSARDNLYVRGHVLVAHAAMTQRSDPRAASASARASQDAFESAAKPLVGLHARLTSPRGQAQDRSGGATLT